MMLVVYLMCTDNEQNNYRCSEYNERFNHPYKNYGLKK